jgi:hypothetical protein
MAGRLLGGNSMTTWRDPGDPDPQPPPADDDEERSPFERPPFDQDPEAQRAPGAGQEDPDSQQPPMQAGASDELSHDAMGADREPVGNDNIREGRVGGVMGPPHQSMGQGQGG